MVHSVGGRGESMVHLVGELGKSVVHSAGELGRVPVTQWESWGEGSSFSGRAWESAQWESC